MTDEELQALLDDLESDRVERKRSFDKDEKIRQTVCAFANDLPSHAELGVLFIGVDDLGVPVGLEITDQLLQTLAHIRDDGLILPFPSIDVQKRRLKGREIAVVFVSPSKAPPVRYKGTVWVRSGTRLAVAHADDERRLNEKRRFYDFPPDIQPVWAASLEAIDELLFRRIYVPAAIAPEVMAQNNRSFEHQLLAVKFAYPGNPVCPTVLGILTVGRMPTDWIPGAYVQFGRFDGTALTDPIISQQEFRGPLVECLPRVEDTLKVNISTAIDFTSSDREIKVPDYPIEALRQIFRNALLHRSYENTHAPVNIYWFHDRIEVHSPGGPYGRVTEENFGQPGVCDYRNPNLAEVMKNLAYVQHFGLGIPTVREKMARNGNPDPEFKVTAAQVAVILRRRR